MWNSFRSEAIHTFKVTLSRTLKSSSTSKDPRPIYSSEIVNAATMTSTVTQFSLNDPEKFQKYLSKLEPVYQTLEPEEEAPPSIPSLEPLEIVKEKSCVTCGQKFETRTEQVEHFRSDWHRLNVKARLKQAPTFSEAEFEQLGGDCESISVSDNSSDDEVEKSKVEVVFDTAKLLFMNSQGNIIEISRILLRAEKETLTSTELLARVGALNDIWLGLIVISGGHFAAAIYRNGKIIRHKTFHQYTVRRKQGGAESNFDNKARAAKSAGASLRRYNEKTLLEKSYAVLKSWPELNQCSVILFRALGFNRSILFGGNDPVFRSDDIRLRTIPMVTRRPTLKELDRIYTVLTTVKVVTDPSNYYETKNVLVEKDKHDVRNKSKRYNSKNASSSVKDGDTNNELNEFIGNKSKRERSRTTAPPPKELVKEIFTICRNDDIEAFEKIEAKADKDCLAQAFNSSLDDHGNTVIHFCCRRDRLAILERMLALGANPTVANNDGQTPYTVASSDKVRDLLIPLCQQNPVLKDYRAKIPDKIPKAIRMIKMLKNADDTAKSTNNMDHEIKERDLSQKSAETMTPCDHCRKEFYTTPFRASDKEFCSVNCVRAWRFS